MDDWTIADTWEMFDHFAEKNANAEFISACKNGDLKTIEFELQHIPLLNFPLSSGQF